MHVFTIGRITAAVEWWKRMKALRLERGLKGTVLSERTGLSPQRISDLEAGRYPSPELDTLLAVCQGLGITIGELIDGGPRLTETIEVTDLPCPTPPLQIPGEVSTDDQSVVAADGSPQREQFLERIRALGLELAQIADQLEDFDLSATRQPDTGSGRSTK